jgi:hypothetical protein
MSLRRVEAVRAPRSKRPPQLELSLSRPSLTLSHLAALALSDCRCASRDPPVARYADRRRRYPSGDRYSRIGEALVAWEAEAKRRTRAVEAGVSALFCEGIFV